ncbi:MAG: type II toxin-antitoxin system RelE family toxin [Calditrichia bacterium]
MSFQILLKSSVKNDLKGIDKAAFGKLFSKAFQVLMTRPGNGKALLGNFSGYYRLRVGDYRTTYIIRDQTVIIARIGHRSEVYNKPLSD